MEVYPDFQNNHQKGITAMETNQSIQLFNQYLKITGVAHTGPEPDGDARLLGTRVGLLNGSSWISLWSNFFGRMYLPGAHLINAGNEAVQINFMEAHERGLPTPPATNIEAFAQYARDLILLGKVDVILITCSTMNRAFPEVQKAVQPMGVPVIQIDRPMMERAVAIGGRTLVVATHGPTVHSTQALLQETAHAAGRELTFSGVTEEAAWHHLANGEVERHNACLAAAIRSAQANEKFDSVVLAQLSMSVFQLTFPDPIQEFGVPILTSGQCGFEAVRDLLIHKNRKTGS